MPNKRGEEVNKDSIKKKEKRERSKSRMQSAMLRSGGGSGGGSGGSGGLSSFAVSAMRGNVDSFGTEGGGGDGGTPQTLLNLQDAAGGFAQRAPGLSPATQELLRPAAKSNLKARLL